MNVFTVIGAIVVMIGITVLIASVIDIGIKVIKVIVGK